MKLPRLGKIRTKESTQKLLASGARITSATVRREADRWFVSLTVEVDRPDPTPLNGPVVGVDRGIISFAVCSDGRVIDSPKALERGQKKLRRLNKSLSRKRKGSNNRAKAKIALARHHAEIRNQRRDALNKATTQLAKTKSVIVVEDLNVSGMIRNRPLARAISDMGWGSSRVCWPTSASGRARLWWWQTGSSPRQRCALGAGKSRTRFPCRKGPSCAGLAGGRLIAI